MSQSEVLADAIWVDDIQRVVPLQEKNVARLQAARGEMDESALRSLDSALKKTTAFMKKLKTLSAAAVPSIIAELSKLNLSKFVEEMAQAIAETKVKITEVPAMIDLCVEVALRYSNFSELLLTEVKKCLPSKKADKVTNPAKLRVDLRFLSELILNGIVGKEGLQVLGSSISFLCLTDKSEYVNVGLICSLCRSVGWQIAGIVPSPETEKTVTISKDSLKKSTAILSQHQKVVYDMFIAYHEALMKSIGKTCSAMNKAQRKVKRQERTRGDSSAEEKADLDEKRATYERLKKLGCELSGALGIPMVELEEEPSDDEEDEEAALQMNKALTEGQISLWPDDETRIFYENILDIKKIVPKNLYKESEERTIEPGLVNTSVDQIDMEGLEGDKPSSPPPKPLSNLQERARTVSGDIPEASGDMSEMRVLMQKFVVKLETLVNRDLTDEAALEFVSNLNNKTNRKRLVKVLYNCPSSRFDLLPFYSRLVALLQPVMPDVATEITNMLIKQFREYIQGTGSDTDRVEDKNKCVMYIAELVKFGVIPRAEALSCLRQLVYDFRWHYIDMAASMIESVGLYLYRNMDSHPKMKIILDVMLKKKERVKDERHLMLIDNAFYSCVPPEGGVSRSAPPEPTMKLFIKHLILNVTDSNIGPHMKCLRRLDWANDEVVEWCLKYMSSPWLVPYENLERLASVVAGVMALSYHDWVAVSTVDSILETIRISLEVPGVFNQAAIACIAFLGQLYNYSVCDSSVIIKTLYQLISFPEPEDSCRDFFRFRLVCELLNVVGEFFQNGKGKKKLDCFLVYFHRYYWMKKEFWNANFNPNGDGLKFPADIENTYKLMMRELRRDVQLPKDLAEAERTVEVLEESFNLKADPQEDDNEEEEALRRVPDRSLHHIAEEEEEADEERFTDSDMDGMLGAEGDEEDEEITVHMQRDAAEGDDDEFIREFDKMVADSYKNAPSQQPAVQADMTIPTAALNRYHRVTNFEGLPIKPSARKEPTTKVALMTRGKGNKIVLKTVSIDEQTLHENWQKQREREEEERADMKRVTLGHSKRIQMEEEILEDDEKERRTFKTTGSVRPNPASSDGRTNAERAAQARKNKKTITFDSFKP